MRLADIFGRETDCDSPVLLLRDLNRLKKMRAQDKFNAIRHLEFVGLMYGTPDQEDGDDEMFHTTPPPPSFEPKFSMPDGPIMRSKLPPKFDDDPLDHLDDMDRPGDDETELTKDDSTAPPPRGLYDFDP